MSALPLARELLADADAGPGPIAVTFEGAEAYMNVRFAVYAMRRAPQLRNGAALASVIDGLAPFDIGGFRFTPGRAGLSASDWVAVGYRQRYGMVLR